MISEEINILGLNAYHGDSASAIVRGGRLIAASEEERFTRQKHWAGIPSQAIKYCLKSIEAPLENEEINKSSVKPDGRLVDKKYILFFGRLTYKKGLDFLVLVLLLS